MRSDVMLDWIPQPVWESVEHAGGASIVDIILLLWSLVCVGLVDRDSTLQHQASDFRHMVSTGSAAKVLPVMLTRDPE